VTSPSGTRHRGGRCRGTTAVAGTVDAHPHLTLPGGAHGIDRAADPTPRLLDVAEDNARLLGQAAGAGPGRWARRSGTAGAWPDHAGALAGPARLPLCPGGRRLAGPDRQPPGWAAGRDQRRGSAPGRRPRPAGCRRPWRCWSPGTASGRPPGCPGFASAEGRAALAERPAAAHASVRLAHGAGVLVGAGTDFGGGGLRPNQPPWEVQTLVAAGLEPSDALAAATINGGRLLGEPGAGVLAQGPGRHPARPRRPPDRPGIAVAGVTHQLVTVTHSALATTSSHLPIRRQATLPRHRAQRCAGGRDRDRTCDFCRVKTSPPLLAPSAPSLHTTTPQVDT
jgi:hypothetical protein